MIDAGRVLELLATLLLGGTGGGWLLAWTRERNRRRREEPRDHVELVALLHKAQEDVVADLRREMDVLRRERDAERAERIRHEKEFNRRLQIVEAGRDYEQVAAAAAVAWASALLAYILHRDPNATDVPQPSPGLRVYMQHLTADWALPDAQTSRVGELLPEEED